MSSTLDQIITLNINDQRLKLNTIFQQLILMVNKYTRFNTQEETIQFSLGLSCSRCNMSRHDNIIHICFYFYFTESCIQ